MSKADDELSRRLHLAERPVHGDGLFEGLSRRRVRRERIRRAQAGMLALAVLAATAGGFLFLRHAFDTDERNVGDEQTSAVANGEIVFAREDDDGRSHIFAARPDGSEVRQITEGDTTDSDPVVSPDGRTIAFVRVFEESGQRIAAVGIDGGEVTHLSENYLRAEDPAWSMDGRRLAYVTTGIDSQQLSTVDLETRQLRHVIDFFGRLADPTWSADGTKIAFAGRGYQGVLGGGSWDLATVVPGAKNKEIEPLLVTNGDDEAPAWSPDGTRIAFTRPGDEGDKVWTIGPDGGSETLLATAVDTSLEPDLAWAPDGTALLVSDGTWIYRVEVVPSGDPRDNVVPVVEGRSPAWQPIPVATNPSGSAEPNPPVTPNPSPEEDPAGQDVGLRFPVCQVSELTAQFDGEGVPDTAIVATRLADDGRCPSNVEEAEAYVGIDVDQDGFVDASYGPIACEVYYCRAFAAPDLDGDDGKRELLVVESAGSVVGLGIYALPPRAQSPGNTDVLRIEIGEPGLPEEGFISGEPAKIFIGGDEGWSYRLGCEDHGINRFLYWTRAFREVDAAGAVVAHQTTLAYYGMRLNVFDAAELENPPKDGLGPQPTDLCGTPIPAI
jgi:Tol biopolymer transport system component